MEITVTSSVPTRSARIPYLTFTTEAGYHSVDMKNSLKSNRSIRKGADSFKIKKRMAKIRTIELRPPALMKNSIILSDFGFVLFLCRHSMETEFV
jgi:hypothetical protein